MNTTSIEWTTFSSNPLQHRDASGKVVWACVKKSSGCLNCYAEAVALRFERGKKFTGLNMGGLTPFLDEKELKHILTAKTINKKPVAGSKCFLGDMTDVFGSWVPDELLNQLFAVLALRSDVTFQLLTKRPERMRTYCNEAHRAGAIQDSIRTKFDNFTFGNDNPMPWPLPNVWLGTSVENQSTADERIPQLLATPAAVRFLSCEPLLGEVDLERWLNPLECEFCGLLTTPDEAVRLEYRDGEMYCRECHKEDPGGVSTVTWRETGLDWVIVGGESGRGSRPMAIEWARSLVRQCREARVPAFVKQLGAAPTGDYYKDRGLYESEIGRDWPDPTDWNIDRDGQPPLGSRVELPLIHKKGADVQEWPVDLRVREFPTVTT